MKILPAVILIAVFALSVQGQTTMPSAQTVIDEALKIAKVQDKALFIEFRASWCSWCRQLDQMLASPEVGKLFTDNFVLVSLTVQESDDKLHMENPGAQELMDKNGAGKAGVPYYLLLDKNGMKLNDSMAMPKGGNIGYPATPEEIQIFGSLLPKAAPRLTATQRASIAEYLTKHAPKQE